MGTAKRVLIVEDDEILRHGMRLILEAGAGYQVEEAANGREGKECLEQGIFDLVVSDVEMPVMDGVQLLDFVKRNGNSRFLMISEVSHALQFRQAISLGADYFLNKPFSKDDFLSAVQSALNPAQGEQARSVEADFVPVPLTDFITGSILRVDLFVRLSDRKFLKIGNKGGTFSQERALAYQAKGVRWFYMMKADFAAYVGFNINIAQMVHSTERIEYARKIRVTMHVTETLIAQLRRSGLNRGQLENASNVVMNAVELITSNPSTLKLLQSMETSGTLPAHSITVGIWACLIARQMKWDGHSTYFKLAICALFHDVGEKELDAEMQNKARFEMSKQDRKIHEGHVLRGRDILQSVPGMPEDAALVALQHHELCSGGGYPYGMKRHQIHPFARLISLADAVCDLLKGSDPEKIIDFRDVFRTLMQNARDFDPVFLSALGEVLAPEDAPKLERPANAAKSAVAG